jgi:hypothetical protein
MVGAETQVVHRQLTVLGGNLSNCAVPQYITKAVQHAKLKRWRAGGHASAREELRRETSKAMSYS